MEDLVLAVSVKEVLLAELNVDIVCGSIPPGSHKTRNRFHGQGMATFTYIRTT